MVEATLSDKLSRLRQRRSGQLILELDLTEGIAEEPPSDVLSAVLTMRRPRLADVLDGLRRARADDKVHSLVVKIGGRRIGLARVQELRLRQTQVLAPDNGVISSRSATVGAVLPAGMEMFRLIRQGRLEWRAEVTSAELSRIAVGTQAFVVSASGAQVRGKVRSIAPTVDPQTRAALVYVDLPNVLQNTGIKAGMFARGDFELGRSSAPTVPQASVVPRDGFNNVFMLLPDNRVAQLKVQIGRRLNDRVEITSAMPEGAQIVVQGAGFLNDGDLVRVVAATPPPATAEAQPPQSAASAAAAK